MSNMLSAVNAYGNQMKLGNGSAGLGGAEEKSGKDFASMVQNQIKDMVDTQYTAETAKLNTITGKGDITELVTAIANAEMALNTIVTIRDKAISAYQEILRMPM